MQSEYFVSNDSVIRGKHDNKKKSELKLTPPPPGVHITFNKMISIENVTFNIISRVSLGQFPKCSLLDFDKIKMDILEIGWGGVDWIGLGQDRGKWRALVNAVMNLRVQ
jgi:hypothetical protein